ncbi:hypothetical protein EVAR_57830_1 [Eumeta japonica]|uniref:Uncharacterized protein n=1 Tax=Eumeta variegata TaxID=151549 RepID=A0A4C1YVW2_EUMVA|nr:hypothetical protein EVAR_57830_1 [Eumeta japonica]
MPRRFLVRESRTHVCPGAWTAHNGFLSSFPIPLARGELQKKRHSVSLSAAVDKRRAPNSGVGSAVKSVFDYYLQNQPSVGIPDIQLPITS